MAEAKKMMESPEFKKQMKKLEGSKDFKESTKKAREAMKDPATAARMEAQMEHMLTKGQDQLKNNAKNQMAEATTRGLGTDSSAGTCAASQSH